MATIKEIRTLCGMTQNDFSKKVGINIRLLQKYESGECSLQNMSAKVVQAFTSAFGCSLEEMLALDTSIFSDEVTTSLKNGDLSLSNVFAMAKYQRVKKCSKIGAFDDTFRACYDRIPSAWAGKLSVQDLADLVDAFYDCYSDGKRRGEQCQRL